MRAEDGAQTRDPQLGRLMLYQLSYFRISNFSGQGWIRTTEGISQQIYSLPHLATLVLALTLLCVLIMRAEDGTQTRDPQLGRLMLYQLSYFRISNFSGQRWIRTTEGVSQQIYSLPHLATLVFAL